MKPFLFSCLNNFSINGGNINHGGRGGTRS